MPSDDRTTRRFAFLNLMGAGRHQEALALAEEAWEEHPEDRMYTLINLATAHVAIGHTGEALDLLDREEERIWRLAMLDMPPLAPLRQEPRFQALRERAHSRVEAAGFKPRLLVTEPDPPVEAPPLLLGLHGATATADEYHRRWLPATRLGCAVASVQSSQPASPTEFCWDHPEQSQADLRAVLSKLPAHSDVVLTGFSQGAAVALHLALSGDLVPATGLIMIAPGISPGTPVHHAARPLRIALLLGGDDPYRRGLDTLASALREDGSDVTLEVIDGLGHAWPPDFAERIPDLLRQAGITAC